MAEALSVKVLTWEGVLTVEQAREKRDQLLAAMEKAAQVVISVSLIESMDIAMLQVLCAGALEAARAGKEFHLTGTLKSELRRAMQVSGLVRDPVENAREVETELFCITKGLSA